MTIRTHIAKQEEGETERAVQIRATDPGSPADDQLWVDESSGDLKFYDGADTIVVGEASLTAALGVHASDTTTHGTTGDIVGTSDAQALTNKTIDADSNTITNIKNADIKAAAGIVDTKLATIATAGKVSNSATTAASANTASAIVARDGSGNFAAGIITAALAGNVTGDVTGNVTGNVSGTAASITGNLTGDVISTAMATTIAAHAVTNGKLATVATQTIKGRTTASTGDVEDLTATQATAILDAVVGDSGSGGTKGLVPAPAAGDAAAAKFLKADGSWATPAGGGGGGSLQWIEDTDSPLTVIDNNNRVYLYADAITQYLYALIRVPASYIAGKPINLKLTPYSKDATTKTMLIQSRATLIRTGTDAVSSSTNQRTSTNTAASIGGATVDIPQAVTLDLTSSIGQINSVSVSAGDLIKVRLTRDYSNDTSAEDVYVTVYGAEVTFT